MRHETQNSVSRSRIRLGASGKDANAHTVLVWAEGRRYDTIVRVSIHHKQCSLGELRSSGFGIRVCRDIDLGSITTYPTAVMPVAETT